MSDSESSDSTSTSTSTLTSGSTSTSASTSSISTSISSSTESKDNSNDKSLEKPAEKPDDSPKEKSNNKSKAKSDDEPEDKSEDKPKEKSKDKSDNSSKDKSGNHTPEKPKDKSEGKYKDKSDGKSDQKSKEKINVKSKGKSPDKIDSKSEEKSKEKSESKSKDKLKDKSSEKSKDKSKKETETKSKKSIDKSKSEKTSDKKDISDNKDNQEKSENDKKETETKVHSHKHEKRIKIDQKDGKGNEKQPRTEKVKRSATAKHVNKSSREEAPRPKSHTEHKKHISKNLTETEIIKSLEEEDREIEAVYQFNTNPRKNIGKLCAYFQVEETPENIAHVIRTTNGLLGDQIGDYLARKESEAILTAYFMEVDMKCDFIEAMRRSLSGPMFLPGEGQMIDRVMQTFANCYCKQNPDKFHNPDALYVLAFALTMLNSDQHNPRVQRRMTQREFVHNTIYSLNCDEITEKDLARMYEEIRQHAFQFQNQSNNEFMPLSAPKLRGYLEKKSDHSFSRWTRHYFVLASSCLYYFKDDNPANKDKPLGMIQLTEVEVNGDKNRPLTINIDSVGSAISYVKFTKKHPEIQKGIKNIVLKAPDRSSGAKWLHRIKKSAIISGFQTGKPEEVIGGTYNTNDVSDAGDESTTTRH
ncbi:hypothetical protein TRFO_17497 [Tritrichomonas foetus]|uniref:Uncharacterized protein n=1 Tax=Tritrichomonas foetus TaxID=1144522 RepID=A0A1J4KMX3_9EUKA|nr:hypothetical protein TRFO_17497 [Tritrichomonas foetus]|eukprot:OHT12665.1 hypothetical protein TRFO_17497 [Tritrichomonas foetus]